MNTEELRAAYLVQDLFTPGVARLVPTDLDRATIGGVVPADKPLALEDNFADRREIGVINLAGAGTAHVDGRDFPMAKCSCLYIGRGSQQIEFSSADAAQPAWFYLVSYPAHATHPTRLVELPESVDLGSAGDANRRTIRKCIHPGGVASCQLVMGYTELAEGSVWNTMPPHTHLRRSEIYLYFDLPADAAVFHFMGRATETRHLVVRNGEAVLSPAWSLHCGAGTKAYRFVWAMGGENQEFSDMDPIRVEELR